MEWQKVVPVVVSIFIIIAIAALRAYSKTLAAITATMPVNVALTLWIVYSAEDGKQAPFTDFTWSMVLGIIPTTVFVIVAWLTARMGWNIVQILLAAYGVWGVGCDVGFDFWGW
ncbi:MAG: hypothetical protein HZB52_09105 [Chloroflexi bacterium]|nr:hypothetical protein [Chloroflexota bacterium]